MVPGLERINNTLTLLGLKQPPFPMVQVVGTNGKGSTTTMLAALATQHGITVGTHTSPHFVSPKERIRINNNQLSDELWIECANDLATAGGEELSYFEYVTALALIAFSKEQVDIAIMETGLGGTWDATTAINAHFVVFTPINIDHIGVLGSTLTAIATDKAGAIRPNTPVISAPQPADAWVALQTIASNKNAPLLCVAEGNNPQVITAHIQPCAHITLPLHSPAVAAPCHVEKLSSIHSNKGHHHEAPIPCPKPNLQLQGEHQRGNATLALGAWRHIQQYLLGTKTNTQPCTAATMQQVIEACAVSGKEEAALAHAWLPGRMQFVAPCANATLTPPPTLLQQWQTTCDDGGAPLLSFTPNGPLPNIAYPPMILDGAHNTHGLAALGYSLAQNGIAPLAVIFSCLHDKDVESLVAHVRAFSTGAIFVPPIADNPRAMPPVELAAMLGINAYPTTSLHEALYLASQHMMERMPEVFTQKHTTHPLLICGSLYLLGEVFALRPDLLEP